MLRKIPSLLLVILILIQAVTFSVFAAPDNPTPQYGTQNRQMPPARSESGGNSYKNDSFPQAPENFTTPDSESREIPSNSRPQRERSADASVTGNQPPMDARPDMNAQPPMGMNGQPPMGVNGQPPTGEWFFTGETNGQMPNGNRPGNMPSRNITPIFNGEIPGNPQSDFNFFAFAKDNSTIIVSLILLVFAFIFVILYRRKSY